MTLTERVVRLEEALGMPDGEEVFNLVASHCELQDKVETMQSAQAELIQDLEARNQHERADHEELINRLMGRILGNMGAWPHRALAT